jgi:hypothetical protein
MINDYHMLRMLSIVRAWGSGAASLSSGYFVLSDLINGTVRDGFLDGFGRLGDFLIEA